MDNKKITSHQLYSMTATMSLGGSILVIASTIAGIAKRDAWISALVAVLWGILVILIYYFLGSRYPGMTMIGIIKRIFGKWLGLAISICYVLMFTKISTEVPWYIGGYFGRVMHETPVNVINFVFMTAIIIAVLYGIEAIARASEFFVKVVSVLFIISMVFVMKDIKIEYLSPIMENGAAPVLSGSYFLVCYIAFSAVNIMMIYPRYTKEVQNAKKALTKGILWSGTISCVTILMVTLVLGSSVTAISAYPTLVLAQEINFGPLLTRMEYVVSNLWLITHFMISLFFFYSSVTALAELIGLKDHIRIVFPMGLLVLVMSEFVYPNAVYQANWDNMVYAPFITTFGLIIPFIMMVVYFIKKRFFNQT